MGRVRLFDDQRAVKSPPDLLKTALVGVVPIGSSVGCIELVDEGFAGCDGLLRQVRYAVHGVGHAQPMPMDRRLFGQVVAHGYTQAFALAYPDFRARHAAVVRPDLGFGPITVN